MASEESVYTIWVQSLLSNGYGCTVFNSNGQGVYRLYNHEYNDSGKVYLLDREGKTLCKIVRKEPRLPGKWEGFRYNQWMIEEEGPWFEVQKTSENTATVECSTENPSCYEIEGLGDNSLHYSIIDAAGGLAAEVKPKQPDSGDELGEDAVTLTVQPNVDHLLIMGLVVVCSLINYQM